jgi:hypothetical protein
MNQLVKVIANDDGDEIPVEDQVWHVSSYGGGSPRVICTGEVFGIGEGSLVYQEKEVKRGGITCERCLDIVKGIKSIKL